ncbi:MAG: YbjN domain-containing protein, partial [Alphaproteobacteria bacterium]|nr:YbjN domain-containing protein [Alphaproteobacteria bacterium]
MRTSFPSPKRGCNPIDIVEELVLSENWESERRGDDEVVIERPGTSGTFDMFFVWEKDVNCLQVSCLLDLYVREENLSDVYKLLALANEKVWVGHFCLWSSENMLSYRNAVMLDKDGYADEEHLSDIISMAI